MVLGHEKPSGLPENFSFTKVRADDSPQHWTLDIYNFILNQPDEYFILSLDDFFATDYLRQDILDSLMEYTIANHVGRIQLGYMVEQSSELLKTNSLCNITALGKDKLYRLSTQTSIWKKEYLLKYFNHNWTPWNLELRGSKRALNDGWQIISSIPQPFHWVPQTALSNKWENKINVACLPPEDLKYLIDTKLVDKEKIVYHQ